MTGEVVTKVVTQAAPRSGFFVWMALACLIVAVLGFSATFFLPLVRGTFVAPPVTYVHGTLMFSWLTCFVAQASLIRMRNVVVHRRLGWIAGLLAIAVVISGVAVATDAAYRNLAAGRGDDQVRAFLGNVITMLIFGCVVAAAVARRRDSQSHKRLLLLATMWILFPAWGRLLDINSVIGSAYVIALAVSYSPLVVGVARDLVADRRVHPVYIWVGALMVTYDTMFVFVFQSAAWLRVGRWLLGEPSV